ncbi:AraC family transcriptional regulator [Streptomyces sp. NPDC088747]|uniref:AraC family transcriptional regulator n=1 Tax=Streptomyces sp. NPDC088747 TaxID=3365886 RepID=UPI0037F7B0B4
MSQNRHAHLPGEYIARHQHEQHQLLYVSQGVLAVRTDHGVWVAGAQRAVWTPAHTWHEHRVYGHAMVHTLGFPLDCTPFPGSTPTVVAASALLRELLIACTESDLPPQETERLRAVINDRLRRAHVTPLQLPRARDPRLADACRLVLDDLAQPRTITWLARESGVSERTLGRLFQAEFGTTYPQWRTNVRVFHAMIELTDGANVTEAAHRCGWATTSAFVDTFARVMGQTPGAYRSADARAPAVEPRG